MDKQYPPNTDEYLNQKKSIEGHQEPSESPVHGKPRKSLIERTLDRAVDYIVLDAPRSLKNTWSFEIKPSLKMTMIRAVNVFLGNSLGFTITPNGSGSPMNMNGWEQYHGGSNPVQSTPANTQLQTPKHSSAGRPDGGMYVWDDLEYADYGKAKVVLDEMMWRVGRYGKVRVSEMYEISAKSAAAVFTDESYGWKSLEGAHPYMKLNGLYGLRMPKVEALPIIDQ